MQSYNGSDADYNYELKADRKKRELPLYKMKKAQRSFDRDRETEVQEICDSLRNAKQRQTPLGSLLSQEFRLYSVDHVDYCYTSDWYDGSRSVEFYPNNVNGLRWPGKHICGSIDFDEDTEYDIGPCLPPEHAGLEESRWKSDCQKHEFVFQFLSNDHLKLKVPREALFTNKEAPADAPEVFKFVGIRRDREKEREEWNLKRKRSPSPKDSWFEMNHPMGWWSQRGGFF
ncbi:hypothetical protein FQN50_007252 [Emmonsiellopsis sp. PD_5]|nr:hypothetical protein FQN50_007252 [Emmonsiellopsis sp. PD_5]